MMPRNALMMQPGPVSPATAFNGNGRRLSDDPFSPVLGGGRGPPGVGVVSGGQPQPSLPGPQNPLAPPPPPPGVPIIPPPLSPLPPLPPSIGASAPVAPVTADARLMGGGALETLVPEPVLLRSLAMKNLVLIYCLIGLPPFCHIQLIAAAAYFGPVPLFLFSLLLPDLVVLIGTFVAAAGVGILSYTSSQVFRMKIFLWCTGLLVGSTLYALCCGIPNGTISPGFCGLAGAITMTGFLGKQLAVLTCFHVLVLGCICVGCFFGVKKLLLSQAPAPEDEGKLEDKSFKWDVLMGSMVCSFPIISAFSVVLVRLDLQPFSPVDPISLFTIPTSLRINYIGTYLMLLLWGMLICVGYWARTNLSVLLKGPELVTEKMEEEWRLASQAKLLDDVEGTSSSENIEAEAE